jgi:hypothetical protein
MKRLFIVRPILNLEHTGGCSLQALLRARLNVLKVILWWSNRIHHLLHDESGICCVVKRNVGFVLLRREKRLQLQPKLTEPIVEF